MKLWRRPARAALLLLLSLISGSLLLSDPQPLLAKVIPAKGVAIVQRDTLNIRSGPGTQHQVTASVAKGQQLTIIGRDNDWYQVKISGNRTGWVAVWLVSVKAVDPAVTKKTVVAQPAPSSGVAKVTVKSSVGRVKASKANVRAGAGTNFPVIASLVQGDRLTVLAVKGDWTQITLTGNRSGWVATYLLQIDTVTVDQKAPTTIVSKPPVAVVNNPTTITVAQDNINIRGGPGTQYPIKGQAKRGLVLKITSSNQEWYKVDAGQIKGGWVAKWLFKSQEPVVKTVPALTGGNSSDQTPNVVATVNPVVVDTNKNSAVNTQPPVVSITPAKPVSTNTAPAVTLIVYQESRPALVNADIINVRSGAGTTFPVVSKLYRGAQVEATGVSLDWYQVRLPSGTTGWIAGWLLDFYSGATQSLNLPATAPGTVTGNAYDNPTPATGNEVSSSGSNNDQVVSEPPIASTGGVDSSSTAPNPSPIPEHAWIRDLKLERVADGADLLLRSTAGLVYQTRVLTNPYRLEIEITNATLELPYSLSSFDVLSGSVIQMRISQETPDRVLITVDLAGRVSLKTTALPDSAGVAFKIGPPQGHRVVLDAGHGGNDPGARGPSGIQEKNLTLDLTQRLGQILTEQGNEVIYTRTTDKYITLGERWAIANQAGAEIFVSVHHNASTNAAVQGLSTFFYAPPGTGIYTQRSERQKLARAVQDEMVKSLALRNIGVLEQSFEVIRRTLMPSILAEVGFVSNPVEEKILADANFRQRAAESIARGIATYFDN